MTRHEEFADPVVVPGPNVRSRFTDTEAVEEPVTELIHDGARTCPVCHRMHPLSALVCAEDGTALTDLPEVS